MNAPTFSTRFGPVPRDLADAFWQRARAKGSHAVELYPDPVFADGVALFHASRNADGSCKATVLVLCPESKEWQMYGIDADRETVARWFRTKGVPCLRIGRVVT